VPANQLLAAYRYARPPTPFDINQLHLVVVTAEAAGSSPVVPAILFRHLQPQRPGSQGMLEDDKAPNENGSTRTIPSSRVQTACRQTMRGCRLAKSIS
jgi:hypothetical protein